MAKPRRRGLLRFVVGFVVLTALLALLVVLLPTLVSRFGAGPIANAFGSRYAGTLEVEGPRFAWNSRQGLSRVALLDPDGGLVLRGSVVMPSLLDLLGAFRGTDGNPLSVEVDVEELRLETDAEGRSNLARALEPVDKSADPAPDREPRDDAPDRSLPGLDLLVRAKSVHIVDRREGAALAAAELTDLALRVEHRTRAGLDLGAVVADFAVHMRAPSTGRLTGEFLAPLEEAGGNRPAPQFRLSVAEFDVVALDAAVAPEFAGKLTALLGATLDLKLGLTWLAAAGWDQNLGNLAQLPPLEQNVSLNLSLDAPRLRGDGQLELAEGRLSLGAPLQLAGALDGHSLAAFLPKADTTAAGATAESAGPLAGLGASPDGRFELHVAELDVDLLGLPEEATRTQTAATASLAATVGATGLTFAAPGSSLAAPGSAPTAVEELQVVLTAAPGAATRLVGTARLAPSAAAGAATGSARLELQGPTADALAQGLLADPQTLGALELGGQMQGLSTLWLDNLLSADGLLVDLLGSPIDATVHGRELKVLGDERSGSVELLLSSELASVETALTLEGDTLVPRGDAPLDVRFALTPLSSPRVVGKLVPLVASVVGTQPNQRASLVLRDFRLPLDGDIRKLSGQVVLDAGQVVPSLFPAAAQLLGSLVPTPSATRLGPYQLTLADGKASYENLEVRIDGRPFAFSGSVDLVGGGIDLGTSLRLSSLGGEVGDWVKRAGSLLDPNMQVPVQLVGSWSSPRIRLGAGTERLLQDAALKAAEGALKKELERGLEKGLQDLFKRNRGG